MDKIKMLEEFDTIIIYGAGKIGKELLFVLNHMGVSEKVRYFAKTDTDFEPYKIGKIQVKSIYHMQDHYKTALFLIAVGDKLMPELISIVKELQIDHYLEMQSPYSFFLDDGFSGQNVEIQRGIEYLIEQKLEKEPYIAKKTATHITYAYAKNAGDTVLSWCVRRFLRFQHWDIKSVSDTVANDTVCQINEGDALVIGGGGLFLPDTNENHISGWQWAISNELLEQINVPIFVYSVGYNFFKEQRVSECFRNSLNCLVRKSAFVGLRNQGSVEAVKELLEEELRGKVIYQPCTTTLIRKMYNLPSKKKTKKIAINMAFDREERRFGKDEEEIFEQIYKAIMHIKEQGYEIIYVAHSDSDLKFQLYLSKRGMNIPFINLERSLPNEVIQFYQEIDVAIGMRGHAQMIPFGIGCKIISLGTHDKMRWFLQDVNMEDCYVDLNGDITTIAKRIVDIFVDVEIQNPYEMEERLKIEQERLWEISCSNRDKITAILN